MHALGLHQRDVLRDQRVLRLGEDADEVSLRQGVELDADREAALELGDQVGRLGDVKRAGGDEQDVIGAYHAVLGVDRRAFDDRQQVALHALARHVGTVPALPAGDLVDLVEEDDAGMLDAARSLPCPPLSMSISRFGLLLREELDAPRRP